MAKMRLPREGKLENINKKIPRANFPLCEGNSGK